MKSTAIAFVLWLLSIFGWLGLHRFYLGKWGTGFLWILTFGVGGFGSLVDLITLGEQVRTYNQQQELAHIRQMSMAQMRRG